MLRDSMNGHVANSRLLKKYEIAGKYGLFHAPFVAAMLLEVREKRP
jgi:hypothetical protein